MAGIQVIISMIGQQKANMIWSEVREAYPNRWLIIEGVEARTVNERRILDKIAVREVCRDNAEVMQAYERWH